MNCFRSFIFMDNSQAQLERLEDEDLTIEDLEKEVKRSKALVGVANTLIDTARVELKYIEMGGNTSSSFLENGNKALESL